MCESITLVYNVCLWAFYINLYSIGLVSENAISRALIESMDTLYTQYDQREIVIGKYLDLTKAFNNDKRDAGMPTLKCTILSVQCILLYWVETWSIWETTMKRLEGAHHRRVRQILNISSKDKVTNVKVKTINRHANIGAHHP